MTVQNELILQPYQSKDTLIQELLNYSTNLAEENKKFQQKLQEMEEKVEAERKELLLIDKARQIRINEDEAWEEVDEGTHTKQARKMLRRKVLQ